MAFPCFAVVIGGPDRQREHQSCGLQDEEIVNALSK
jgi:hypothetical protein